MDKPLKTNGLFFNKKTLKINGYIFGNLNKRLYISFVIIDNIKT
jgi:hypothetical protein